MTKTLICDIEANGLVDYTELWYAATYCVETKEAKTFEWRPDRGHIQEFYDYAKDATHWIGHNFIEYDRHVITKLVGIPHISVDAITDTLVRSRLYNSGRLGGHSLERWGAYFHVHKVGKDIEDWSYYQPIMGKRCKRDVLITKKLWEFQKKEGANVPEAVKRFEQHFAELCGRIKNNGFPIDIDLLDKKYSKMSAKRSELQTKIRQGFPP